MPNQFNSPEGDLENYFVSEYWLIDQYVGNELWVWGNNAYMRLGTNDVTNRSTPSVTSVGGTNWKQVSNVSSHTAAIKTDGTLWVWGNNIRLQLGTNDTINKSTPVTTFIGGTNWKQVSCGEVSTAAIKTDGTLWVWGTDFLGLVDEIGWRLTPITTFAGGTNWSDTPTTAAEDLYTIDNRGTSVSAIKTDGTLWTWGGNILGSVGNNRITTNRATLVLTPVTTFAGGTNWRQVGSGGGHTLTIKTDGTLWTWGYNSRGQLGNNSTVNSSTPVTTFTGGTNWRHVSGGTTHTAAIKTDGTLWLWGYTYNGSLGSGFLSNTNILTPITTFAGGTNWRHVSGGLTRFTAAIKTDGTLWVWGNGANGQLGNAAVLYNVSTPVTTFAGGTNWKQVSSGNAHTAAIKTDGTLWTWGTGWFGGLGNAVSSIYPTVSTPITTFAGGTNWRQVSSGFYQTAAIKTDGTLWLWGYNGYGQLGNNTRTASSTPITTFVGGTNWKQVNASGNAIIALNDDGVNKRIYMWGANPRGWSSSCGKLGINWDGMNQVQVNGSWNQISCYYNTMSAIKTDGTLWAWGNNAWGQLGNNSTVDSVTPVTTFAGGNNWKKVDTGTNTAAMKTDGTLWMWGNGPVNNKGSVASGNVRFTPVTTFAGGTNWSDTPTTAPEDLYTVSGSLLGNHLSAIKTDGTLWLWGYNVYGQLGNNTRTASSTPITTFVGGTNWKQVSCCGRDHTVAIKTDGTLWVWGNNSNGQLGNAAASGVSTPVTTFAGGTNWKQVSSGNAHTAAIKTDGTLWTWGNAYRGVLGNGTTSNTSILTPVTTFAGGTNWSHLSCGFQHMGAIKTDGTLWTWGFNNTGALGNTTLTSTSTPVTTFAGGTNWRQVSCGYFNTSVTKTDGTLWVWGYVNLGQLGNNTETGFYVSTPVTTFAGGTNWRQANVGREHVVAIKTDGTLWTWGRNINGKLGNGSIKYQNTYVCTPITTFAGGTNWKQASALRESTIALNDDGVNKRIYVWGSNGYGQLGDSYNLLQQFKVDGYWKDVSNGHYHAAAIKTDGTLWTWGQASYGELGTNDVSVSYLDPVTTFAGGNNWKQVSCGDVSTAAIKTDGTLWVWGRANYGQLGTNDTIARSTPVTTFAGGNNWRSAISGNRIGAAIFSGTTPDLPLS